MKNTSLKTNSTKLMEGILEVRFTDLDELQNRCEHLLQLSQATQDTYGIAFSYLYLFDYSLSIGDNELGRYHLMKTQTLCEENHYNDLLLTFHNLAGFFYQSLFDEQAALQHYLKGLELAQKCHDPYTESKIYTNIGISFRRRHENNGALRYYKEGLRVMLNASSQLNSTSPDSNVHNDESIKGTTLNIYCNLAEVYQSMGLEVESSDVLKKAEALHLKSTYWDLQLAYTWCGHYAMCGDKEKSIAIAQELLDNGLSEYENIPFRIGAYLEILDYMLKIDYQPLALRYLQLLESCCSDDNLGDYYNSLILKIAYYEHYGSVEEQNRVYREFYKTSEKMNEIDDALKVRNVLAKMELSDALYKRRVLRNENEQLKQASHIDELTKLYNRRYVSKLQTKVLMGKTNPRLGYIILDIDYFKEFNDFYGHSKGDDAICFVADTLKKVSMEGTYACRYGGDEFLILCVDWSNDAMHKYVLKIQNLIAKQNFVHEKSKVSDHLTLSIGYSNGIVNDEFAFTKLLEEADKALYKAKAAGRNQSSIGGERSR